jgi:hypothetical protein
VGDDALEKQQAGADGVLMDCTLEWPDARHPGGTPSNNRVLMKLASRGTNTCPTLSLLQHMKLQGAQKRGVAKLLDLLNGGDTTRIGCGR